MTTFVGCLIRHRKKTIQRAVNVVGSFDPNEKVGPVGVGAENYTADTGPMAYTIYFENDPNVATAAAQVVTVTDQLDIDLDWDTFEFGLVSFGDRSIQLEGGPTSAFASVFMIENGLTVDIEANFDPLTGTATWTFTTIDPRTGALTQDPLAGFLPPNVTSPEGEGNVQYRVRPRAGVTTGTQIANAASIVFDVNDPIITNTHVVTFDFDAPESAVEPLAATVPPSFMVTWSGTDVGSGIATFDIFVSVDSGPFTLWLDDTPDASATFAGQVGRTYGFYSVATDRVGHVEAAPASADTASTVPVLPADFNGDLVVGLVDLAILQSNQGTTGATLSMGDLNGDGVVNRTDAALFALAYGRSAAPPSPLAAPSPIAAPPLAPAAIVDRAVGEWALSARRTLRRLDSTVLRADARPAPIRAARSSRAPRHDAAPSESQIPPAAIDAVPGATRRRRAV